MIHCGEPQVGEAERRYAASVLESGYLTRGKWCSAFAEDLARVVGVDVEPVATGTAALHLALLACGVGPGDEVIVPATTYVATGNAVLMCGATPVIVDVDPKTWTIDEGLVDLNLTMRTKAIMPVHLYGVPASDCRAVLGDYFRRTGREVYVIEDCAEALGAAKAGVPVGSTCDAAAFSFYASKTITTAGEGGAVASRHACRLDRARHLATQGMTSSRYYHDSLAWNYRMTEVQAAFGCAQIERLGEFLLKRKQVFDWYDERIGELFRRQECGDGDTHGYWAYAILLPKFRYPSVVAKRMAAAGVETRPVFPPLWSMPQFPTGSEYSAETVAEDLAASGLVLPTHCGLTEDDVDTVCKELVRAVEAA